MYRSAYQFARLWLVPGSRLLRAERRRLEQIQWLSPERLNAMRLDEVRRLVAHAYEHVPFYRRHFAKAKVDPRNLRSWDDFAALPCLTRDDVNNNYDELIARGYRGAVFPSSTGGSTGRPMRFLMDRRTAIWSAAVEARNRAWYGVKMGDRIGWIWGAGRNVSAATWTSRLAMRIKRFRLLDGHSLSEDAMASFAAKMRTWRPAMYRAYPSAAAGFARFIMDRNGSVPSPRLIETCAEKLFPPQREVIERVFRCPIAEHYSSWEIYSIAYQCPHHRFHVCEDRHLEVLDGDRPARPGEQGRIAVTALTQYAMPLIRYLNEDLGVLGESACPCGRGLPVLREITGRATDALIRNNGKPVYTFCLSMVVQDIGIVREYQIYQNAARAVTVSLVLGADPSPAFLQSLEAGMHRLLGADIPVKIVRVDRIPRTAAGKLRQVVSEAT